MKIQETQHNWNTDPKNWKWHYFYYNVNDSRLMVEKRDNCAGITFNFAHKISWFWTVLIFLFVSILIYYLPRH